MRAKNDYTINKIFARAGQMKSTTGYWIAERTKWYNLVLYWQHYFAQIPSVFLTVSEPELHDPALHKLLDQVLVHKNKSYYSVEPPPADEKLRRKLAVTENLPLVSWFFVQKMRSLHHRVLYPKWNMLEGADGRFNLAGYCSLLAALYLLLSTSHCSLLAPHCLLIPNLTTIPS